MITADHCRQTSTKCRKGSDHLRFDVVKRVSRRFKTHSRQQTCTCKQQPQKSEVSASKVSAQDLRSSSQIGEELIVDVVVLPPPVAVTQDVEAENTPAILLVTAKRWETLSLAENTPQHRSTSREPGVSA